MLWMFIFKKLILLIVLLPLAFGCAMANWPAKVYHNPTVTLSNYHTFSFTLPFTANIIEEEGREKIIKLLEKNGYKYIENKETADFLVEEKSLWEAKTGFTPSRVEYAPLYTGTTFIYIPTYIPQRPYTYYEFYTTLTFYDRYSNEKIYEGKTEGTSSYLDIGEIYEDLVKQSNLPLSLGHSKVHGTEQKVYARQNSKIYHKAGCPDLGTEGLIEFTSAEEADNAGGIRCPKCNP